MEKTSIVAGVFFSVIVLFFLNYAYSYTKSLEKCSCVSFLKSNITNIKNIELFLIAIQIIGIFMNIGIYISNIDVQNIAITNPKIMGSFLTIYLFVLITILINFIYNVYVFGTQMPTNCDCANKWQKDILYIQAAIYSFTTISTVFLLFFGFYIGFIARKKNK